MEDRPSPFALQRRFELDGALPALSDVMVWDRSSGGVVAEAELLREAIVDFWHGQNHHFARADPWRPDRFEVPPPAQPSRLAHCDSTHHTS